MVVGHMEAECIVGRRKVECGDDLRFDLNFFFVGD